MAETNTQTIIQEAEQFQTHCELLDAELTRASEEVDEFRSLMAEDFALRALAMAPRAPWPTAKETGLLVEKDVITDRITEVLASRGVIRAETSGRALLNEIHPPPTVLEAAIQEGRAWPVCRVCGMDSNFALNGEVQGLCYEHHSHGSSRRNQNQYNRFRPLSDQVLVRPLPPSNRMSSQSRVVLPANVDRGRLDNRLGVVLALGPGDPVAEECQKCDAGNERIAVLKRHNLEPSESNAGWYFCCMYCGGTGFSGKVNRTPFEVQVGDTILYAPRGWAEIQIHGEDLIVIHDCQGILAVVDPDAVLFAEDATTKRKGPGWS